MGGNHTCGRPCTPLCEAAVTLASASGPGPPCPLRASPVYPLQQHGQHRRGQCHNAVLGLRPHEPAALQPFRVERHASVVVPKDLHQVSSAAPENIQVAPVRIAPQRLLHLQGQARPFMPRRISVVPAASQTRTPLGSGITAAPPPSPGATPPSRHPHPPGCRCHPATRSQSAPA